MKALLFKAAGMPAAIALLAVASSGIAHASLVCNTPGVCVTEASFALLTQNYTGQSLTFDQFDTSLGTLNSITLTFLATGTQDTSKHTEITTSGYLQNTGNAASGSTTPFLGHYVNVNATMTISGDANFNAIGFQYTVGAYDATLHNGFLTAYSGTAYTDITGVAAHGTDVATWSNVTATLSGALGATTQTVTCGTCSRFTGNGTFTIGGIAASGSYTQNTPNSFGENALTQSSVVADITYNYTPASPTPEPSTMALFGGALIGLGVFGKRFRRNA